MGDLSKMKSKIMSNCGVFINVITIILIFVFTLFLLQFEITLRHDFFHPYDVSYTTSRLPAYFLSATFINWLPQFFNMNPNDFRMLYTNGFIGLFIICLICSWNKMFFCLSKENIF